MLAIVLQGALRDGVTTWMPSYISETYNLSSSISILTGVLLPIFSLVCFHLSEKLYQKVFTNPLKCAGIIFGAGAFSSLMIQIFTGHSAAMSVVFSAALTGCMHGVNLMLICMIPAYFKKSGNVSTISGVLNSCTYVGSAVSTYGVALISDSFGWSATLFSWTAIAIAGMLVCLAAAYPLSKKSGLF
jgi:OPA family glycerol-3-phosphate transporter-like MFS transporter